MVVQRLSDELEIRGGVGPRSVDGGFQKSLGHGDGVGLADSRLGRGDEVSARVDAVELRGLIYFLCRAHDEAKFPSTRRDAAIQ